MESHLIYYDTSSPPLVVDMFRQTKLNNHISGSNGANLIYFLTHFHYDHYCGIGKTWSNVIYTSYITGTLLERILGVDPKYICKLSLNKVYELCGFKFTFVDANHCPGSVLIIFEFRSGKKILHTGDFRYHPKVLKSLNIQCSDRSCNLHDFDLFLPDSEISNSSSSFNELHPLDESKSLLETPKFDTLILDTTFSLIKFKFPSQDVAVSDVIEDVSKHLKSGRCLFLFGSYLLGKERLYFSVAHKFSLKLVFINKKQHNIISSLPFKPKYSSLIDSNTCNSNDSEIHVVPMGFLGSVYPTFNPNLLWVECYLAKVNKVAESAFNRIVAYVPSGWSSKYHMKSKHSNNVHITCVTYSEHSSYNEIEEFLSVIKPGQIIPSVYSDKSELDQLELMYLKYTKCATKKDDEHVKSGKRKRQLLLTDLVTPF